MFDEELMPGDLAKCHTTHLLMLMAKARLATRMWAGWWQGLVCNPVMICQTTTVR